MCVCVFLCICVCICVYICSYNSTANRTSKQDNNNTNNHSNFLLQLLLPNRCLTFRRLDFNLLIYTQRKRSRISILNREYLCSNELKR